MIVGVMTIDLSATTRSFLGNRTVVVTLLILVSPRSRRKVIRRALSEQTALRRAYVLKPLVKASACRCGSSTCSSAACCGCCASRSTQGPAPVDGGAGFLVLESGQFMRRSTRASRQPVHLEAITVEDVMTPRARSRGIDLEAPTDDHPRAAHHRVPHAAPGLRGELATSWGILHLRKVMHLVRAEEFDRKALAALWRKPYFRAGRHTAFAQLQYFQENHRRIALVGTNTGSCRGGHPRRTSSRRSSANSTTTAAGEIGDLFLGQGRSALVEGSSVLRG